MPNRKWKWSEYEDEYIINNYYEQTSEKIAIEFDKPAYIIRSRAKQLGLRKRKFSKNWTTKEEKILKKEYLNKTFDELAALLNKNKKSIKAKCVKLNLRKLENPRQILTKKILEEHYIEQKKSVEQIAKEQNIKSKNSVIQAIQKYNLTRESIFNLKKQLTKEYLIEHYINQNKSAKTIASELGYSNKKSVLDKLKEYKIKKKNTTNLTNERKIGIKKTRTGISEITGGYWKSIKHGAKRRKIEFSLAKEYIWELFLQQNRRCALSGISIQFKAIGKKRNTQTASLDRIDSSKGYIKGNVQWIDKRIQRMKWQYSQIEFIYLCSKITEHRNKKFK